MRGYKEEGTTTTPFDMVMLNDLDRFHLVIDVIDRVPGPRPRGRRTCARRWSTGGSRARAWTREHGEDHPDDPRLDLAVLTPAILVVNAGSTSLKLSSSTRTSTSTAVESLDVVAGDVDAVGHRIVHGGRASASRSLDRRRASMRRSSELRRARAAAQRAGAARRSTSARQALPDVPHVAVFDTAFHATMPDEAATYAVPRRWREEWGIAPLRLPRPLRRSGSRERVPRAAARRLPPRRRLLGDGRARRPLGRHDDGLQPARRRADGDALRLGRSRRAPLPAARRRARRASSTDALERASPASRRSAGSTIRSGSPSSPTASPGGRRDGGRARGHRRARVLGRRRREPRATSETRSRTGCGFLGDFAVEAVPAREDAMIARRVRRAARSVVFRTRPRALCGGRARSASILCAWQVRPLRIMVGYDGSDAARARARRRRRPLRLRLDALVVTVSAIGGGAATTAAARAQLHRRHIEARYHETSGEPADSWWKRRTSSKRT